ncbi:MAG: glucosamine-6-phosphate deaminase [Planctomycetota bacterium]
MRVIILNDAERVGQWTAAYIAMRINKFDPKPDKPFVLGLPTGSTPVPTYRNLIKLNKEKKVSFRNVVTFNMDEYVGLPREHPESYWAFMYENLFNHVDIKKENVNILNGMAEDLEKECESYEEKIKSYGGVRLFLGGIGPDGHIAFNEPGSSLTSRTRVKTLTTDTKIANSRFFGGDIDKVPGTALTVGVGTVLDSHRVVILVTGHNKARALHHVVEEGVNHMWTVSALQLHQHGLIVCDDAATVELKVGTANYFKDIEKLNVDPEKVLRGEDA